MHITAQVIEKASIHRDNFDEHEYFDDKEIYYYRISVRMVNCPLGHMYIAFKENKYIKTAPFSF